MFPPLPLSFPLRLLLLSHNSLAEGEDGFSSALLADHLSNDSLQGEILANFFFQNFAQHVPRWTDFQRVLRRIPLFFAMMTMCRQLSVYLTQVLTETIMFGEHLRHPEKQTAPWAVYLLVQMR